MPKSNQISQLIGRHTRLCEMAAKEGVTPDHGPEQNVPSGSDSQRRQTEMKVNDKRGNPIEIAAVVVWRVEDTAQAMFDVDNSRRAAVLRGPEGVW
jgi:regulator of protease activity HflC (stomatin/prohibitin superfamily)